MVKMTPVPKNNSLYSDKNNSFKCLLLLYKSFHIIFGLDFGFIKFEWFGLKIIPKIFAVCSCLLICGWTLFDIFVSEVFMWYNIILWYCVFLLQYLVYVIILIRINEESTFCNLIQDLRTIDLGLKTHHGSYNLELKLFLSICTFFMYRVSISYAYCAQISTSFRSFFLVTLFVLVIIASDIVRLTYAFMFYAINCRLKKLEILLKEKNTDFLSIQYLYKSIVDISEQHKEAFDPVQIISLLFNVPQVMATMYISVQEVQSNKTATLSFNLSAEYLSIVEMLTLTIMPAICAGMLSTEAHNIKVILHDLLLQPRDDAQSREIERFIGYVCARECRFRVCKVIPLDADLLGMVISFCVTYLIVIIQFTNK